MSKSVVKGDLCLTSGVRAAGLLCERCEWPWIRVWVRLWAGACVCMYERVHDFSHEPHVMCDSMCVRMCVVSDFVIAYMHAFVCRRPSVGQAHRTHCLRLLPRLGSVFLWWAETSPDHIKSVSTCGAETRTQQKEEKELLRINWGVSEEKNQPKFIYVAFHHDDSLSGLHSLETKTASEVNEKRGKKKKRNL